LKTDIVFQALVFNNSNDWCTSEDTNNPAKKI